MNSNRQEYILPVGKIDDPDFNASNSNYIGNYINEIFQKIAREVMYAVNVDANNIKVKKERKRSREMGM